jgi:secreted PhoX family phosphatase
MYLHLDQRRRGALRPALAVQAGRLGQGTLTLVFESPSGSVLDSPDNLCVTPSGAVLFCEDDANPTTGHRNDSDPLSPASWMLTG